ncbi:MAG TPA: 6-pyruvoyl-tetrahydropterin synthase-related protein, partial [Thermoanaerobaculia bacterium]|nr:6-pyruvoyl-tetrahydropterin synthase-related protein [Thermoanaerobaculia bacterium]
RDEGGYPFGALASTVVERDATAGALPRGSIEAPALTAQEPGTVRLALAEGAAGPSQVSVRLLVPSPLEVLGPDRIELPAAGATTSASFRIRNRTAFPGSALEVLALVERESDGVRDVRVLPATVRVERRPLPTGRLRPAWLALLGVAIAALALLTARDRRRIAPPPAPGAWLDVLALAAAWAYLLALLPSSLLWTSTTTAGGDTASHFLTARYLTETLLPEGRLLGWMPGNLGGYPIFQLYFPLPFLLIAALAPLAGLAVAFKLGTLAGTFLLPLCAYLAVRAFGFARPAPALAALFTLPFLLIETNSVWGGNLPSTLAGEFAYSLGLALTVLYAGTSFRGLASGRGWIGNGLLLALVGLSHAYALLAAGLVSTLHALWVGEPRKNAGYLARVYLLAFALLGFWIVPLLGYAATTTPYRDHWAIGSWREVLPPILLPWAALALVALFAGPLRSLRRGRAAVAADPRLCALGGIALAGLVLYRVAPLLGAVDIRFLPFFQLSLALLAAPLAGALARRVRPAALAVAAVAVATLLWVDARVSFTPQWAEWNYSGFEAKPDWPAFAEVNARLRGDATDPRVVFEHSPAYNAAGSIRAFESLPLFSGRSTLEGLYIQSSLLSPEIFYLQSELSPTASCPLPDFHCAGVDPARAAEHLRQFAVDRVVVRSRAAREALAGSPEFALEASVPPYEIHRVEGGDPRYVVPLETEPVVLATPGYKDEFFRWFARPGSSRVTLLWRPRPDCEDLGLPGPVVERLPDDVAPMALPADGIRIEERIEPHRITIRTDRPGHPLLVRIAYHPRWRARGGERVYLASPGFLAVVPRGPEVVLEFGDPPLVRFAHLLTLGGLGVLLLGAVRSLARARARAVRPRADRAAPGLPALSAGRWRAGVALSAALLAGAWLVTLEAGRSFPARLYEQGMELYRAERFEAARRKFEQALAARPLASAAPHASFYRALAVYREGRWREAAALFEESIRDYPASPYRAESAYHVGLCRRNAGDLEGARRAFRLVSLDHASTPWAGHAAARLAELPSHPDPEIRHAAS